MKLSVNISPYSIPSTSYICRAQCKMKIQGPFSNYKKNCNKLQDKDSSALNQVCPSKCGNLFNHTGHMPMNPALPSSFLLTNLYNLSVASKGPALGLAIRIRPHLLLTVFRSMKTSNSFPGTKTGLLDKMYGIALTSIWSMTPELFNEKIVIWEKKKKRGQGFKAQTKHHFVRIPSLHAQIYLDDNLYCRSRKLIFLL